MELIQAINAAANLVTTIGISAFMVFVFGKSSVMYTLPWLERTFIKTALAIAACGAFESFLRLTNPPISEVVLNVGLAMIFSWGAYFHFKRFVIK